MDILNRRSFLKLLGGAATAAAFGFRAGRAHSNQGGIFDTHVHIAVNDPARYPLGPEFGNVGEAVFEIAPTAEKFIELMDDNGVEQAVLVQHDPVYGEDNSYIADSARRYPRRMVAVGRLEAGKTDAVEKMLYWVKERGLSGFRINGPRGGGGSWIESDETMKIWEKGAELETPLLLLLGGAGIEASLASLGRALKKVPDLKLVLDHMADFNHMKENELATVQPALLDAAAVPNLFVKVSTHNLKRFTVGGASARPALERLVEAFGAHRIVWGSDLGNSKVSYPEMISMARDAVADLTAADQTMILSGTAKSLYRPT